MSEFVGPGEEACGFEDPILLVSCGLKPDHTALHAAEIDRGLISYWGPAKRRREVSIPVSEGLGIDAYAHYMAGVDPHYSF